MSTKYLRAISLLLPLMAISATAHAGSTITDKSYWPNEARQSAQNTMAGSQRDVSSAFAFDRTGKRMQPVASPSEAGSAWHYQGGPKSR